MTLSVHMGTHHPTLVCIYLHEQSKLVSTGRAHKQVGRRSTLRVFWPDGLAAREGI
jgi:hypothetical protein